MEEKILVVGDKKFRLIPQENLGDDELVCDRCPYSDICDKLPDPRNPENPELSFEYLCSELGEMEKPGQNEEDPGRAEIFNSIPAPGSLETIYPEFFKK
jgi:hypothetical protein